MLKFMSCLYCSYLWPEYREIATPWNNGCDAGSKGNVFIIISPGRGWKFYLHIQIIISTLFRQEGRASAWNCVGISIILYRTPKKQKTMASHHSNRMSLLAVHSFGMYLTNCDRVNK